MDGQTDRPKPICLLNFFEDELLNFFEDEGIIDTASFKYESRCEKTGLRGFCPGPTQTGLCSHIRWLEA